MKAIAYNIKPQDKEWLTLANHKKHDITFIANSLTFDTLPFANGKETLILFNEDPLSAELVHGLKNLGIKYIATSSFEYEHIDLGAAKEVGLKIASVPFKHGNDLEKMHQVIKNLDNWAAGKCVGKACRCQNDCAVKPFLQNNENGKH